MKFLILAAIVTSMGLASCGWKENPLSGTSAGVQKADPPDLSEKPQGDDDNALKIDSDDTFYFNEGQESQYTISGRILIPTAGYVLSIDNLTDFPEAGDNQFAKFDASTGVFDWTPADGFITDFNLKKMNLKVTITSTGTKTARSTSKNIIILVTPSIKVPEIMSVTFDQNQTFVREGDILKFDVMVKDVTGVNLDGSRPTISLLPSNDGSLEAGSLVEMQDMGYSNSNPTVDANDPTLWDFHMQVNLKDREVTTSSSILTMIFVANSRFHVVSKQQIATVNMYTSLQMPSVTWSQPQEMKAGQQNSFTFMVFDPRGEGDVQFNWVSKCSAIDPNLVCGTCVSKKDGTFGNVLYCPVTWNIPADYFTKNGASQVTINMSLASKSKISGDSYSTPSTTVARVIKVLQPDPTPAPAPTPTPSPTPSPAPAVGGN